MKVFLTVRKFYQVAVICRPQTEQNYHFRFSWKYLIYIAFLVQASISAMTYFLFKAHSIVEHADAFYTFSTAISCAITISLSIWKISNIFQFIEKLEKFIEKSKLWKNLLKNLFSFVQNWPTNNGCNFVWSRKVAKSM